MREREYKIREKTKEIDEKKRKSQQKMGVAIPLSVFHSMFAPVFGAIAHQFSDLRDPAGKDRLYGYRESNTLSFFFFFFTKHNAKKFYCFLSGWRCFIFERE